MAGRGTDIKLSEEVKDLGGLFVIGTQRHEARRIDNQLRGRSGRLGDPGASLFFVSLEDELMRRFGGETMKSMFNTLQIEEDTPIESSMIARAIKSAQKKVENINFEIRKKLVEYDDVLNNHREIIYSLRDEILYRLDKASTSSTNPQNVKVKKIVENLQYEKTKYFTENFSLLDDNTWDTELFKEENFFNPIKYWILQKFLNTVNRTVKSSYEADQKIDEKEKTQLIKNIFSLIPPKHLKETLDTLDYDSKEQFKEAFRKSENLEQKVFLLYKVIIVNFIKYYQRITPELIEQVERAVIFSTIDQLWTEHLDAMRLLREGINLRSYAQKDPLIEYKNEGYKLFDNMIAEIGENISERLFKVRKVRVPKRVVKNDLLTKSTKETLKKSRSKGKDKKTSHKEKQHEKVESVRRNDPCPCGSGEKYKKCCFPKYE
jgi:preprotein translocase subunit SecA